MKYLLSIVSISMMAGCVQPTTSSAPSVALTAGPSSRQRGIHSYVVTADGSQTAVTLEGADGKPVGDLTVRVVDSRTDHATLRLDASALVLDIDASPDAIRIAANGRELAHAEGDRVSAEDLGASLSDEERAAFETVGTVLGDSVLRPHMAVAPDGLLARWQPDDAGEVQASSVRCADAAGGCFPDGTCGPPSCRLYAAHFFWGCYCYGTTGHPCNPFTPWQCRYICYPNGTCS